MALVADNDPFTREVCRSVLEQEGWDVLEIEDGPALIQLCQNDCPDIILIDAALPGLNGIEAIQRLRASPITEGVPIVILSDGETTNMTASLQAGADSHICKPFSTDEFALRVQSLTRLQREWRRLQNGRSSLGEQARTLDLLLDFSAALSRKEDLNAILGDMISVISEIASCRRISIMLPDASGKYLSIAASMGIEDHVRQNVKLEMGESIAGRVFMTGRSILLNSQQEVDGQLDIRDQRVFQDLPLLSMPMCASEKVVGVLNLTSRIESKPFSASELSFLSLFTNYAASAIQNMRTREARDQARDSIVIALAKLAEHRDDDTGKHLDRVTLFCLKLAEELRTNPAYANQIDDDFLTNLQRAAPLHDIGKVAIPDAILLKPGRLTEGEMTIMRTHARIGAETIHSVLDRTPDSGFLIMAEQIAHSHHEWFDGSGYPQGLRGEEIPLSARILALADVYDALTTKRVYKNAFSHRKSVEIILKESGTHFDPDIVKVFIKLEPEFEQLAKELADNYVRPGHTPDAPSYGPRDYHLTAVKEEVTQPSALHRRS